MDTFFEQIISIKMTGQKRLACIALIIVALVVSAAAVFGAFILFEFMFVFALIIMGVWFGVYKLIGNFKVEYEYIITNGELDIDMIIDKSRRKRIITVKCSEIESIKKYNFSNADKSTKTFICCNANDDAYAITVRDSKLGVVKLVIAPNEKIKSGIVKFIPRFLVRDAFI